MALPEVRPRRMQICRASLLGRSPRVLSRLERAGWVVEREECLDQCTRCLNGSFALVEGEFVFGRSPEDFLRRIK